MMATNSPIQNDRGPRLQEAIHTLHAAATGPSSRPPRDNLLSSIVEVQQKYSGAKFTNERAEFFEALAGPGNRWKLVYVCGKEAVIAARKRATPATFEFTSTVLDPANFGLLQWFPPVLAYGQYVEDFVTAIQRFDGNSFENENGIYELFGSDWVRVTVTGPFKWPGSARRQVCAFRPNRVRVRIGSWDWESSLEDGGGGGAFGSLWSTEPLDADAVVPFHEAKVSQLPFFKFMLVDDKVAVAMGRSGSVALWARIEGKHDE
eukprot:CAMPEP_0171296142 /NCGR_PEP_ID=MMETSP0816-20121228/4826_1 /TAXON_ID=420281 /ORGANISM="Proboscia inermis, Strain CCAP1064/1" /LENGTH=261 /DNA_ID=CAMNT_0011769365 /DNA_START=245 /DNA_END=1030 /DNA_ORIENTATION=-